MRPAQFSWFPFQSRSYAGVLPAREVTNVVRAASLSLRSTCRQVVLALFGSDMEMRSAIALRIFPDLNLVLYK